MGKGVSDFPFAASIFWVKKGFCNFLCVLCVGVKVPRKQISHMQHSEAKNVSSSHVFSPLRLPPKACAEFHVPELARLAAVCQPSGVTQHFTSLCFAFVRHVPVGSTSTDFSQPPPGSACLCSHTQTRSHSHTRLREPAVKVGRECVPARLLLCDWSERWEAAQRVSFWASTASKYFLFCFPPSAFAKKTKQTWRAVSASHTLSILVHPRPFPSHCAENNE